MANARFVALAGTAMVQYFLWSTTASARPVTGTPLSSGPVSSLRIVPVPTSSSTLTGPTTLPTTNDRVSSFSYVASPLMVTLKVAEVEPAGIDPAPIQEPATKSLPAV